MNQEATLVMSGAHGDAQRELARAARVRKASFDDYEQIAAVLRRNGLAARPYRQWLSLWEDNPAYERQGRGPIGWVLEAKGAIVGTISALPSTYYFGGRELRAASCGDWAVDPAYRTRSLTLLKKFSDSEDLDLLVSTTVNRDAETAFRFCNWRRAPVGGWDTSAFWITNIRGLARAALSMKSIPLAGLMRLPAGLLTRRRALAGPRPEMEVRERFDDRFDEFWESLQRGREGVLLGVRTRRTLEWHYGRLMDLGRIWIVTASSNSRMEAYAVFERRDVEKRGVKRALLIDMQTLPGRESLARHILQAAFERCRSDGVNVVESIGDWLRGPDLPKPFRRALSSWLYHYKANAPALAKALEDADAWAPSCFDGDLCL